MINPLVKKITSVYNFKWDLLSINSWITKELWSHTCGFFSPQRSYLCFLYCITFESDDPLVLVVGQQSLTILSVEKQLSLIACSAHQWFVEYSCCLPGMQAGPLLTCSSITLHTGFNKSPFLFVLGCFA